MKNIKLVRIRHIPKKLEPGILYYSKEFGSAVHLCACGCGLKASTPVGPTEWSIKQTRKGPTLTPSVGNWEFPCQSHYFITDGKIVWSDKWTPAQIAAGKRAEEERARAYHDAVNRKPTGVLRRFLRWAKDLFKR